MKFINIKKKTLSLTLGHFATTKGRTIRNPGRGRVLKITQKNSCKEKCLEKNSRSHYVREKKIMQANSKVQIVLKKILAEVKCIKKNPAET
jgi:hypothetical protein